MTTASNPRSGRAFALIELLACVLMLGVLLALLLVSGTDTRRQARLGHCIANLNDYAHAAGGYAADHGDRVWNFSWRKGSHVVCGLGAQNPSSDVAAAALQAIHILRCRAGRSDIFPLANWIPHILYSHLVLSEYFDSPLPQPYAICPEDRVRLRWAADPLAFDRCETPPQPVGACGGNAGRRWPYSSTYELPPSFFSPDSRVGSTTTISQGGAHNNFSVASAPIGRRMLTEVVYPSHKVMLYESHARHFGPRIPFYAYQEAKLPLLFVDGNVSVRVTGDSNPGGQPNNPTIPNPTSFSYSPSPFPNNWEPAPLNGQASQTVTGHYRWTRAGLRGRDFGGAEVPY